MTEPTLLIAEADGVIEVTLNRPRKLNALDQEMLEGLHEATRRLRDRDDLRVLLLTANGKYFSAGIDLNGPLAPDPSITSPSAFRRWYRSGAGSLHPLGDEWEAIELAADLDRAQGRNVERFAVSGLVMGAEYHQLMARMKTRLSGNTPG